MYEQILDKVMRECLVNKMECKKHVNIIVCVTDTI